MKRADSAVASRLAAALELLPQVELAYLFGSYAAGRERRGRAAVE